MFEIVKETIEKSYDDIREEYKGYIVLVKKSGIKKGTVYALSDFDDLDRLSDLQIKLNSEGINTCKVRALGQNNFSLYSE